MNRSAHRVLVLAALLALAPACAKRQHLDGRDVSPATAQDETPRWDDDGIVHQNAVGSHGSAVALFYALWLPAGLVLALAAALAAAHRRRAAREEAMVKDAPLVDGPAVLRGVVETDGGDAITVAITQRRKTFKDKVGNTHTQWNERRREVIARPFRVVTEDGRAVRVEPDKSVLLRDSVEAGERINEDHRLRYVRLQPGERVWLSGTLEGSSASQGRGAYREGVTSAVLKRSRFARMIVSAEAPGAFWTERATFHHAWLRGALITLALTQFLLLGDFTLQTLSGRAATLSISRVTSWDVWVKPKNQSGRWVRHCAVEGRASLSTLIEEHEVSCAFHACASQGRCRTLPTQRAALTGDLLREPGRGPTAHTAQLIIAGLVGWIMLLAYVISVHATRPWYAGGSVNDHS